MRPAAWFALSCAAAAGMAAGACSVPTTFSCQSDDQCTPDGQCVASLCAFPDDSCDTGLRYGEFSPPALAGACVEDELASGSGTGESGAQTQGSESGDGGSESSGGSETGLDTETGEDESGSETSAGIEPDLPTELPPAEVLAHYSFEMDTVEGAIVRDISGNELHALLVGDSWVLSDGGVSGEALGLGGATWLELPSALLEGRDAFTVEFYLATGAGGTMGARDNIFYYGDALEQLTPPRLWAVLEYLAPPTERLRLKWTTPMGTETALEGITDIVTEERWFHVALMVGPEGTQLWVDQQLESKDEIEPTLPASGNEAILLGALPGGLDDYTGRIDELRISDRPLLPEEMLGL